MSGGTKILHDHRECLGLVLAQIVFSGKIFFYLSFGDHNTGTTGVIDSTPEEEEKDPRHQVHRSDTNATPSNKNNKVDPTTRSLTTTATRRKYRIDRNASRKKMTDNNNNKNPNQSVRTGQSFSKSISKKPPNNYPTKEPSIQEPTMKFHPFQPGRPSQRYGSYSTAKEQLRKKAMDQWIALIAIRNSDPTKYSILKRNLNDDYSMGVDKFPTDLDSAVDILINHNKFFTRPKPPPGKPSPPLKSKTTEDDIPTHEGATTSFAQCFKCGSHDHLGPDCKQTKPADEWYATKAMKHYEEQAEKDKKNKDNKEQQHMTIQQTDQLADDPEPTDNVWSSISMTQFNGCQIQEQPINNNNNKYKDLIVLNSAANVDVFNNPQLVNNIKIAPSAIKVGTNNGTKSLNLTAQSRGRNSAVWFDSAAPTNTYSLATLKKDKTVNKIVFDSSKEPLHP
jgi:hypothetical protein